MEKNYDRQMELSNCFFVKTILMILVVLYHSMIFWTGNWFVGEVKYESQLLSIISKWLNSFLMYGFTLVSGYIFYFLKYEQGKYQKFRLFIINKIKRLVIPYIFVSVIWVIPFAVYFFKYDVCDIVIKYILGAAPNQLWFLLMLFGVFIIWWMLSDFFVSYNIKGIFLILFFYGVGLVGQYLLPNVFQIFRTFIYLPFFWIGFKVRQNGSLFLNKFSIFMWLISDIILFLLTQYLDTFNNFFFKILNLGFEFILHIFGALMSFVVLQRLAKYIKWAENKVFCFVGKNSMSIYLFHQQIIYLFIYWLNGIINPYLHVVINFVAAMIISLFISVLMMKFKFTRVLIGEK